MRRVVVGICLIALIAISGLTRVEAELENQIFTSQAHRLRLVVPRGWRATDLPSYPGMLVWMLRTRPQGTMVLSAEPFTRKLYCSWPIACRTSSEALPSKFACALRVKLQAQRLRLGPVQAGPKENEQVGMGSVWFEMDDGNRYLRQAVALREDRIVSLVLSAPSVAGRNAHVRAFEDALRSLRPLAIDELETAPVQSAAQPAMLSDAGTLPDAAATVAGFVSAPAAKIDPVGPCAQ